VFCMVNLRLYSEDLHEEGPGSAVKEP
jgi:hypothetical protein